DKMKLMFSVVLLLLLSCSTSQASDVNITSIPPHVDGVIQTDFKGTVSLTCALKDGPHEDKELVWLRNGATVNLNDGNKESVSHVCIKPIYEDDEATFTCHLKSNASNEVTVTLNVTYHPELSGEEAVTVEEEAVLLLECDMRANPAITAVMWKLNGSMVDLTAGFTVTNDGITSQLNVKKVERSQHEGLYQCTTLSPMYGDKSKTFKVTVTDKTMKFPLMPTIAGLVVVFFTMLLAVVSRRKKIVKVGHLEQTQILLIRLLLNINSYVFLHKPTWQL
uniref:Transmembrane and immunoglobulin domain containing 1 n=1 Tax=Cyprinodon variegatus TaxID=28743 RepID=A0A3Q2GCH6_CYPVA